MELELGKPHLKISQVVLAARKKARAVLSEKVCHALSLAEEVVKQLEKTNLPVYGITTGFGALREVFIPEKEREELQQNLIQSHAAGVGTPLAEEVVRAAILLRAHTLSLGYSGVRPLLVEKLLELLEKEVYPYVPEKGSLGASGDLAPLSHLALLLIGHPEARFLPKGERFSSPRREDFLPATKENLSLIPFTPISLKAKEGLALNNGSQFTTARACLLLSDSLTLLESAITAYAMSFEAIGGVLPSLEPRIYKLRQHPFQQSLAKALYDALKSSQNLNTPHRFPYLHRLRGKLSLSDWEFLKNTLLEQKEVSQNMSKIYQNLPKDSPKELFETLSLLLPLLSSPPVQDDYSFRSALQVFAAFLYAFEHLKQVVFIEINSVTDNPLIFPPKREEFLSRPLEEYRQFLEKCSKEELAQSVRSASHFHALPLALPLDYFSLALSELASIAERRIAALLDKNRSRGLPPFLARRAGTESGLMILQYTAAALVSENKTLAHPASVDTIPTSADREDYVSMADWAARKAEQIFQNTQWVIAMEILTAAQALSFCRPLSFSPLVERALEVLSWSHTPPFCGDAPPEPLLQKVVQAIQKGSLAFSRLLSLPPLGEL